MASKGTHSCELQFASFQKGEEQGFTFFFRQFYRPLLYYAIAYVSDEPAAEDIVEESFIKLWQRREAVQSATSLKPYLYTIVKNTCLDYLKIKTKEMALLHHLSYGNEGEPHLAEEPGSLVADTPDMVAVFKGLSGNRARIVHMFYVQGKPIKQIAEELRLSANTVRNQKVKALLALRKKLLEGKQDS